MQISYEYGVYGLPNYIVVEKNLGNNIRTLYYHMVYAHLQVTFETPLQSFVLVQLLVCRIDLTCAKVLSAEALSMIGAVQKCLHSGPKAHRIT